jgi:hypothetical protein
MTDNSSPPPSDLSARHRVKRKPGQPPRRAPMSAQSKWVGIVVLGFGIVAVAATIMLALHVRSGSSAATGPSAEETAAQEQEDMAQSLQSMKSAPAEQKQPEIRVSAERQKKIKEKDIAGLWQTQIDGGKAVLQIENGIYRIIVSFENKNLERRFSNGTYKMIGDILVLSPRSDWGPPEDQNNQAAADNYRTLTGSDFPVLVSKQGGKTVWMSANGAEDIPPDVYVPNVNPFLTLIQSGVAVWETLD